MGMFIVTGSNGGVDHVTSEQIGAENAGTVGQGRYVFDLGEKFDYEIISNNLVRIKNGYGMNQGRTFGIKVNDYEELIIDNGLAGVSRHDLVVARYSKVVETGIESMSLAIVKGTSSSTPIDPDITTGAILNGAIIDEFPLWRIIITELSITSIVQMFTLSNNVQGILEDIGNVNELTTTSKIVVGAINEHDSELGVINTSLGEISASLLWTTDTLTVTNATGTIKYIHNELECKIIGEVTVSTTNWVTVGTLPDTIHLSTAMSFWRFTGGKDGDTVTSNGAVSSTTRAIQIFAPTTGTYYFETVIPLTNPT
jgi:hypothetical protein